ncbi:Hypothetical protein SMAX5B_016161 [Scophthalmus maximus]|uniref:Uncharacterized protein n=1 Tax=Scophthalmus maximus TaxID=52904 RepID=A0A2U9CAV7_SCOMX|nr:Hypothetical protein SMAX5B_016161 [Scophthalmus maximus]KAF0026989.1 hypothetical protein F2P81_021726 [Scophthalmus maximus]
MCSRGGIKRSPDGGELDPNPSFDSPTHPARLRSEPELFIQTRCSLGSESDPGEPQSAADDHSSDTEQLAGLASR